MPVLPKHRATTPHDVLQSLGSPHVPRYTEHKIVFSAVSFQNWIVFWLYCFDVFRVGPVRNKFDFRWIMDFFLHDITHVPADDDQRIRRIVSPVENAECQTVFQTPAGIQPAGDQHFRENIVDQQNETEIPDLPQEREADQEKCRICHGKDRIAFPHLKQCGKEKLYRDQQEFYQTGNEGVFVQFPSFEPGDPDIFTCQSFLPRIVDGAKNASLSFPCFCTGVYDARQVKTCGIFSRIVVFREKMQSFHVQVPYYYINRLYNSI